MMLLTNLTSVTNKSKKTVLCVKIPELYKTVFRTDNHKPKIYNQSMMHTNSCKARGRRQFFL